MSKILIAFSGGPDSVFLYYFLKKRGHELALCYINHNVRSDVENDIKFINEFSKKEEVPLYIKEIKLEKFNEDIARKKRYEELEKCLKDINYDYIATGHNKNDNVETLIFRLLRGTGFDGLKGIPRKRGKIIRPILDISKEEILNCLNNNKIKYLIDYTNLENNYSRNKIRNLIFPIFKDINENFLDNISRLIQISNENIELKEKIKKELNSKNIAYNKNKIDEIYNIYNKYGSTIRLNEKYIWCKTYNYYGIREISETKEFLYNIKLNEEIEINGYTILLCTYKKYFELEKKGYYLYNVKSANNIQIRNKREGDKLDNTKLKKIFINLKIDRYERNLLPIILVDNTIILLANLKKSKNINEYYEQNTNYIAIKKGE